jgi:uncharacterized membrane protein
MSAITSARRSRWLVPASLVLLSLVPALAGTARLAELAADPEVTAANERFVAMPLPVVLHIVAVIPFSIIGAFQFSAGFRRRNRNWHRRAGTLLVPLGLMAAATGLWMTVIYPWANNDAEAVYAMRLLFGSAMAISIVLAVDAIRRRDFRAHGEWMIRGYAIGLGAGTQVLTHLPWFILVGRPGELSRAVLMGAGWVINVIVAEWIIRSSAKRPGANPTGSGPAVPGIANSRRCESLARAQACHPSPIVRTS